MWQTAVYFDSLFNQSTVGVAIVDLEGNYIEANAKYCDLVGRSMEELRQMRTQALTHPDDLSRCLPLLEKAVIDGESFVLDKRYVRPDDSVCWVSIHANVLKNPDGKPTAVMGIVTDITHLKQLEQALADQSHLNQTLTENITTSLLFLDKEQRTTYVNPAWEKMSGYTLEEMRGQIAHNLVHHTYPDGRPFPMEECPIDQALPFFKPVRDWEDVFVHKDGHFYNVICNAEPIYEKGEPIGTVVEVRDITMQKEVERSLREAKAAADRANQRKSQFLANMSHELRTPLNAIIGFSEMLLAGMASSPEKQQKYIENIATSGHHLLHMVNDILDLSKVEADKMHLERKPVDLESLLMEVLEELKPQAASRLVRLHFHRPPERFQLEADPVRLRQVVYNLLTNAIKFNKPNGQVYVRLSLEQQPAGTWCVMAVEDTGIGIPQDKMQELFSQFYQIDSSTSRKYEGTGLGLALTKRLVELHGGTIEVKSEESRYSIFTVRLPMTAAEASVRH
jgi:PAS domain S-box-containing protein